MDRSTDEALFERTWDYNRTSHSPNSDSYSSIQYEYQYSASNPNARVRIAVNRRTVHSTSRPQSKSNDIVSIPVRGASSQPRTDRNVAAAVKIQSAFRGYRVRKGEPLANLKLIRQVLAKTREFRERLQKPQEAKLIRQNQRERLRIAEQLMSLLLKLDAIQGVHSFVRESRKAAVREILDLQETLDAMAPPRGG